MGGQSARPRSRTRRDDELPWLLSDVHAELVEPSDRILDVFRVDDLALHRDLNPVPSKNVSESSKLKQAKPILPHDRHLYRLLARLRFPDPNHLRLEPFGRSRS